MHVPPPPEPKAQPALHRRAGGTPAVPVVAALLLILMFLAGLFMHTPAQSCALDPDCARAPVTTE